MRHPFYLILLAFAMMSSVSVSHAAVVHSEVIDGELSNSLAAPTLITLASGPNTIVAQVGNNGQTGATNSARDADYLTFSLAANQTLDSVTVDSYSFAPTDPGRSFMAYTVGSFFTGQSGGDIDGNVLFNGGNTIDVLDDLGPGSLGPGSYAFWIQETSNTVVDYSLTFNVITAVPEPSSLAVLLSLGAVTALRRRR